MDAIIIFCAKYMVWIAAAVGTAFFAYRFFFGEWRRLAIGAAAVLGASFALGKLAEWVWYDPRPFVSDGVIPLISHAANNGFPSDHTLMASAIAATVMMHNRPLGTFLWAVTLLVGASRVLGGIHHWIDIVGAALISLLVALLVEFLMLRFYRAPIS